MADKIRRVEYTIDENDGNTGIKFVSLVDEPAIESDFVFFNKEKNKSKFVKLEKEGYKNTVFGAVLIPDKDILRIDENGVPYNGYFSKDTIEKMRNKFHKELQTNNVNEMHNSGSIVNAYLNESYIIDSEERLIDAEAKGLVDIVLGTWVASYKIEDDETFQKVIDGELNGFSIEAYLNKEFRKINNNKEFNKVKIMKNKLIERLSKLIEEFSSDASETVELVRAVTVDGDMYEWGEVGQPVLKVITNSETQEETTEEVSEGEYTFEDGSSVVVDADGNLVEFKPAQEETTEEVNEDLARATLEDGTIVDYSDVGSPVSVVVVAEDGTESTEQAPEGSHTFDDGTVIEVDADGNLVSITPAEEESEEEAAEVTQSIDELIDLTKDGFYSIEVSVEKGKITYGAVYSSSYKELEFKAEEKFKAEKAELEKKIEELNNTILANPINEVELETTEEVDFSKLSNIEKIALRNKIKLNK